MSDGVPNYPAGGADVPFFGMSATADSEGRIHADKKRRHVCATRGRYEQHNSRIGGSPCM